MSLVTRVLHVLSFKFKSVSTSDPLPALEKESTNEHVEGHSEYFEALPSAWRSHHLRWTDVPWIGERWALSVALEIFQIDFSSYWVLPREPTPMHCNRPAYNGVDEIEHDEWLIWWLQHSFRAYTCTQTAIYSDMDGKTHANHSKLRKHS